MKKLLAVLLVLGLVLAFVTPLFAEGVTLEDLDARVKVLEGFMYTDAKIGIGFAYETSNSGLVLDPYTTFTYDITGNVGYYGSLSKGAFSAGLNGYGYGYFKWMPAEGVEIAFNTNKYYYSALYSLGVAPDIIVAYKGDSFGVYGGMNGIGTYTVGYGQRYVDAGAPYGTWYGLPSGDYTAFGDTTALTFAFGANYGMDFFSAKAAMVYYTSDSSWSAIFNLYITPVDMFELDVYFSTDNTNNMGLSLELYLNNLGPASLFMDATLDDFLNGVATPTLPFDFGAIVALDPMTIYAYVGSSDLLASTMVLTYEVGAKVYAVMGWNLVTGVGGSTATGAAIKVYAGVYVDF